MKTTARTIIALLIFVGLASSHAEPVNIIHMTESVLAVLSKAKNVAVACKLYANDNEGRYPKTLTELVGQYLTDNSQFETPGSPATRLSYEYFGGSESDSPKHVLLCNKPSSEPIWIVFYSDFTFEFTSEHPRAKTTK